VLMTLTRPRTGFHAVVKARTSKPRRRPALAISCKRRGKGLRLTVKPSAPGETLAKAGATTLAVGFINPAKKPVTVHTVFTAH
jgi:hypothetical protein